MAIDIEKIQGEFIERLPLRARWLLADIPWDWDFSRARDLLRPLATHEFVGWVVPVEWRQLYVFGEQDFAKGGGASPLVGIHIETGRVYNIDIERDDKKSVYLLNSSASQFVEVFFLFDQVLGQRLVSPVGLTDRVRKADQEAFNRSEWRETCHEIERPLNSG